MIKFVNDGVQSRNECSSLICEIRISNLAQKKKNEFQIIRLDFISYNLIEHETWSKNSQTEF